MKPSTYYDPEQVKSTIARGEHREAVGGLWDEMGQLQCDFLKGQGLTPEMTLLDIGCGCLRGGIHFIDYLNAGNYFGQDINQAYMDAGYEEELGKAGLQDKLPRSQLFANEAFDFSPLPEPVDMAIAQSLFTHLPLNHIRQCLHNLAAHLKPGGALFATFFPCASIEALHTSISHNGGITTTHTADPYHYFPADFDYLVSDLPYEAHYIGEWGHPRAQHMLQFKKTGA